MTDNRSVVTCLCGSTYKGDDGEGITHRSRANSFICPCGLKLFYEDDHWKALSLEGRRTACVISLNKLNKEKGSENI